MICLLRHRPLTKFFTTCRLASQLASEHPLAAGLLRAFPVHVNAPSATLGKTTTFCISGSYSSFPLSSSHLKLLKKLYLYALTFLSLACKWLMLISNANVMIGMPAKAFTSPDTIEVASICVIIVQCILIIFLFSQFYCDPKR